MKPRNQYVSYAKIIASCFIVFIHVPFEGLLGDLINCLARFAVPFFFAVSGYYSFQVEIEVLKRRIIKCIVLLSVSSLIYFAWGCINQVYFEQDDLIIYLQSSFSVKSIAGILFLDTNPFSGHLWYMMALIWVYIIYIIFRKMGGCHKCLYVFAACAFLFTIVFGLKAVGVNFEISHIIYRNGLFLGLPMFCTGLYIKEYQKKINKEFNPSFSRLMKIVFIGNLLSIIQWFGYGVTDMPLPMILVVPCILLITIVENKQNGLRFSSHFYKHVEKIATMNYLLHPLVIYIIQAYARTDEKFFALQKNVVYPLIVLIISLLISIIGLAIEIIVKRLYRRCSLSKLNTQY